MKTRDMRSFGKRNLTRIIKFTAASFQCLINVTRLQLCLLLRCTIVHLDALVTDLRGIFVTFSLIFSLFFIVADCNLSLLGLPKEVSLLMGAGEVLEYLQNHARGVHQELSVDRVAPSSLHLVDEIALEATQKVPVMRVALDAFQSHHLALGSVQPLPLGSLAAHRGQLLAADLVVVRQEKLLGGRVDAAPDVQNAAIAVHVHEVLVEDEGGQHSGAAVQQQHDEEPRDAAALDAHHAVPQLDEVVEAVAGAGRVVCSTGVADLSARVVVVAEVHDEGQQGVEDGGHSVGRQEFRHNLRQEVGELHRDLTVALHWQHHWRSP